MASIAPNSTSDNMDHAFHVQPMEDTDIFDFTLLVFSEDFLVEVFSLLPLLLLL